MRIDTTPRPAAATHWERLARALPILASALLALGLTACRQDMHNQPKVKPLTHSDFFADGQSSRSLPAGTVPRGYLREDQAYYAGRSGDQFVSDFPMPVTRQVLQRGQERYNIFCSPCHSRLGDGRGMIVRRGYKQPPSYHEQRLRDQAPGYFFDVMTNGFATMPGYASQIPVEDRWAIAAYIRALQLSQSLHLADLTPEEREKLMQATQPAAAPTPMPATQGNESGHE